MGKKHKKQVKRRLEEIIEQESYNVETSSGKDHVEALNNLLKPGINLTRRKKRMKSQILIRVSRLQKLVCQH